VWECSAFGNQVARNRTTDSWERLNRAFDAARRDALTNEQLTEIVRKEWSR
jgi:DNA-binding GntR family transcriptional regulator